MLSMGLIISYLFVLGLGAPLWLFGCLARWTFTFPILNVAEEVGVVLAVGKPAV